MATIQTNIFDTKGINLASPIFVQNEAVGAYVVSANQIAWGNSKFNGATFDGTTLGLLTAIENKINGIETGTGSASDYWDEYTTDTSTPPSDIENIVEMNTSGIYEITLSNSLDAGTYTLEYIDENDNALSNFDKIITFTI